MLKLNAQLERVDPSDRRSSAKINSYVEENILPYVSNDGCLPLSMLVYMSRKLIEPDLLYGDIPRLLEGLAAIETVRHRTVEQAHVALGMQKKFVTSQEPGVPLLRKADEKKLLNIVDEDMVNSLRLLVREDVVHNLFRLHICHLWTSPEAHTIMKFMKRYFPSNYTHEGDRFSDERWGDLLHRDLTPEERRRVHDVGEELKEFLSKARAWDLERGKYFKSLRVNEDIAFGENEFISYSRDFNARFRSVINEKRMMESLKAYLKKVQDSVNTLERLFPSPQYQAERAAMALFAKEAEVSGEPTVVNGKSQTGS